MGTHVRTVCLIGILMLSLAAPVLAQGTPPASPGVAAPSGPGVGAPSGPGFGPGPGYGQPGFGMRRFGPGPGYGRGGFGMHRFGRRRSGVWMLVKGLFSLLLLLLLVGLLLLSWRLLNARRFWDRLGHRQDSSADILRERYARGEIDEDEYRKRLATLA